MSLQTALGTLATTLAFTATAQTPPTHYADLPVFGKTADTACTAGYYAGRKPEDLLRQNLRPDANFQWILGNDCMPHAFELDSASGNPVALMSTQRANNNPVKPVHDAQALPAEWWKQADLLSTIPQGVVSKPSKHPYCTVQIGNGQPMQIPAGSVVIPDTGHAYFIKNSTIAPAEHCKAELMIKMPEQPVAVASGGIRNPGNISFPPNTTPAGAHANPSGFGSTVVAALFNLLGKYTDLLPAYRKDNCVILNHGMDKADVTRRIRGLTPEQAAIAAPAFSINSNTNDEIEKKCQKLYDEVDIPTCNGISRSRGPAAAAKCFASAMQRYAACLRNTPIPPLNTWN